MERQEAPTCPASAAPGTHPRARAIPPPDFGSLWQDKACLDSHSPPCPPAPALKHSRRSMNTARRAPAPLPPLIKHQLYFPNTPGTATGIHGEPRAPPSEAIPPSAPGVGILLQPRLPAQEPRLCSRSPRCGSPASGENGAASTGMLVEMPGPVRGEEGGGSCQIAVPRRDPEQTPCPPAVLQDGGHAHPLCLGGSQELLGPNADGEALVERQSTERFLLLPRAALPLGFHCRPNKDAEDPARLPSLGLTRVGSLPTPAHPGAVGLSVLLLTCLRDPGVQTSLYTM